MQLNQTPHDCQPEAQTAPRTVGTPRSLLEQVEDVRQKIGRDANAIVTHAYHRALVVPREGHVDATAEVGVFGGIGEKVREALFPGAPGPPSRKIRSAGWDSETTGLRRAEGLCATSKACCTSVPRFTFLVKAVEDLVSPGGGILLARAKLRRQAQVLGPLLVLTRT